MCIFTGNEKYRCGHVKSAAIFLGHCRFRMAAAVYESKPLEQCPAPAPTIDMTQVCPACNQKDPVLRRF